MISACRLTAVLCLALILGASPPAHSKSLGSVIFLRASGDALLSPTDVLEKNLDTGKTIVLISHESLPADFKTIIDSITPSPDGKYLYFSGSSGMVFRNKTTGETRTVLGGTFSFGGEEELIASIDKSDWYWERGKSVTRIDPPSDCTGDRWYSDELKGRMQWSPKSNLLLGRRDLGRRPYPACLYLYDTATRSARKLCSIQNLDIAIWSADGNGVITVESTPKRKGSHLSYLPLKGKSRRLFDWPRYVWGVAESPDGSDFVISDEKGFYLVRRGGRQASKLRVPTGEGSFDASFQFNKGGDRLAILVSSWSGEPRLSLDQQLWVVDTKSRRADRVVRWVEFFQGSDPATERRMQGWLPDGKTVVIVGAISYGEKPVDNANDWFKLWLYDTQLRSGKGDEVFDSGKRCLGVAWWLAR